MRCVTIELRNKEIAELCRRGFLERAHCNKPEEICEALYWFLDLNLNARDTADAQNTAGTPD